MTSRSSTRTSTTMSSRCAIRGCSCPRPWRSLCSGATGSGRSSRSPASHTLSTPPTPPPCRTSRFPRSGTGDVSAQDESGYTVAMRLLDALLRAPRRYLPPGSGGLFPAEVRRRYVLVLLGSCVLAALELLGLGALLVLAQQLTGASTARGPAVWLWEAMGSP